MAKNCLVTTLNGAVQSDMFPKEGEMFFDLVNANGSYFHLEGSDVEIRSAGGLTLSNSRQSDILWWGTFVGNSGRVFIKKNGLLKLILGGTIDQSFNEIVFVGAQSLRDVYLTGDEYSVINLENLLNYCPNMYKYQSGKGSFIPCDLATLSNTNFGLYAEESYLPFTWSSRSSLLPRLYCIANHIDFGNNLSQMLIDMAACSGECTDIIVVGNLSGSAEETAAIETLKGVVSNLFYINGNNMKA